MDRDNGREQLIVSRWRTRQTAQMLGPALDHAYPVDEAACFDEALNAIEEAERRVWCDRDRPVN